MSTVDSVACLLQVAVIGSWFGVGSGIRREGLTETSVEFESSRARTVNANVAIKQMGNGLRDGVSRVLAKVAGSTSRY